MVGFAAAMGDNPDWERWLATLGRDFHITRMTFKNHACCGHTFAAIDGALEVKRRLNVDAADIDKVEVATYRAGLEVAHYENPGTPAEGRASLKYVVATALTHGSVRLAAFEPERLADRKTKALMDRISLRLDPELEAAFPAKRAARVAIEAKGRREEWPAHPHRRPGRAALGPRPGREVLRAGCSGAGRSQGEDILQRLWRLE